MLLWNGYRALSIEFISYIRLIRYNIVSKLIVLWLNIFDYEWSQHCG